MVLGANHSSSAAYLSNFDTVVFLWFRACKVLYMMAMSDKVRATDRRPFGAASLVLTFEGSKGDRVEGYN